MSEDVKYLCNVCGAIFEEESHGDKGSCCPSCSEVDAWGILEDEAHEKIRAYFVDAYRAGLGIINRFPGAKLAPERQRIMAAEIKALRTEIEVEKTVALVAKAQRETAYHDAHKMATETKKLREKNLEIEGLRKMDIVVLLSSAEKIVALEKSNAELEGLVSSLLEGMISGAVNIESESVSDGQQSWRWHEEWADKAHKAIANAENGE